MINGKFSLFLMVFLLNSLFFAGDALAASKQARINQEISNLKSNIHRETLKMTLDYSIGYPLCVVGAPGTAISIIAFVVKVRSDERERENSSDDEVVEVDDYGNVIEEEDEGPRITGKEFLFFAGSVTTFVTGLILVLNGKKANANRKAYRAKIKKLKKRRIVFHFQSLTPDYNLYTKTGNLDVSFSF